MPDSSKPAPYIEFRDVSKAFGDNVVLDHVSFNVMPAETVCILGRSGVGKSVSLHHIMGFLKPDSGRVLVAGEDITDYTEEQLASLRQRWTPEVQAESEQAWAALAKDAEAAIARGEQPGSEIGLKLAARRRKLLEMFTGGDPDRPTLIASVPNAVTPTPVVDRIATYHRIRTASGVMIEIDDGR